MIEDCHRHPLAPPPEAKPLATLDGNDLCDAVVRHYRFEPGDTVRCGGSHHVRAVAAWPCRRQTEEPLRALATRFGLSRADSFPDPNRRVETRLRSSPEVADALKRTLGWYRRKTKNKV